VDQDGSQENGAGIVEDPGINIGSCHPGKYEDEKANLSPFSKTLYSDEFPFSRD
jgi:hypothetical protein